ncbi:hypothetical protein HZB90_01860 [archaeon]|nr:hypothetical protein [archaeon]
MGGISGVFASISDASRGIMSEAQERYNENNLFSTNFGAENIVADACMFMFTGEIPTNWDTMLDVATYMPINTSAWVYPATRRFQVYNPENGYARYVYKIAYFITAGADIHYDINLVCSGTEEFCKDDQGNTIQCDCSYQPLTDYTSRGRQPFLPLPTRRGSGDCPENGDLKQLESCSDEIMFVAEGNPLRYDKAVITWRPVMTMGQTQYGMMNQGIQGSLASPSSVSGAVDTNIDEIGGPPFGLCSFNTAQLAFTCGVEIPPTGYARFVSIDLARPAGEPFGIGDSRLANVRIEKALPQDAPSCTGQCDLTKYLTFEIWNGDSPSSSARIYPPYGKNIVGERLNENRLHNIMAFDEASFPQAFTENGEGFVIKPEYFGMQARGQGRVTVPVGGTSTLGGSFGRYVDQNNIQAIGELEPGTAYNVTFDGNKFNYQEVSKDQTRTRTYIPSSGEPTPCEEQAASYDLTSGMNIQVTCGNIRWQWSRLHDVYCSGH